MEATNALLEISRQCEWYQKYLEIERETDPFRRISRADRFLSSNPPAIYSPLVEEQINRARYLMVQRVIEQGDLSRALQLGREHVARVPADELVIYYELMRLAELKAQQSAGSSQAALIANGYWTEAGRLAERIRLAIVNENRQDERLGEAKVMPWNAARPFLLSTLYRIEGLAALSNQRLEEAETLFQNAIAQRCACPPDVYFSLGEIYDLYYDQRAAEFNQLPSTPQYLERRQQLLREAMEKVRQAAVFFARGLALAELPEYKAMYRERAREIRRRVEVSYEIANGGRRDGLSDFLQQQRNFCQASGETDATRLPTQLPTLRSRSTPQ